MYMQLHPFRIEDDSKVDAHILGVSGSSANPQKAKQMHARRVLWWRIGIVIGRSMTHKNCTLMNK